MVEALAESLQPVLLSPVVAASPPPVFDVLPESTEPLPVSSVDPVVAVSPLVAAPLVPGEPVSPHEPVVEPLAVESLVAAPVEPPELVELEPGT